MTIYKGKEKTYTYKATSMWMAGVPQEDKMNREPKI